MKFRDLAIITIITTLSFASLEAQTLQRGKASFYSKRATGSRTSSGEGLHHDSLTCAHRTHPYGSRLKVTNPSTGKSVVVWVIDRGPFKRGRIIDLSWAAAKEIGMLSQGIATVIVERADNVVIPYKPEPEDHFLEFGFEDLASSNTDGLHPEWREMKKAITGGNGGKHGSDAKDAHSKQATGGKEAHGKQAESNASARQSNASARQNKQVQGQSKQVQGQSKQVRRTASTPQPKAHI